MAERIILNMQFLIRQEKFAGPLDLLLTLIAKEKLSITEISLAQVADQYISYVQSIEKIDIDSLAEFLVIAAQLMLLKSKALLPYAEDQEEEQTVQELQERLKTYQQIKRLAKKLRDLERKGQIIAAREPFKNVASLFRPPRKIKLTDFKKALTKILSSLPSSKKLAEEKIQRAISLEEKIKNIQLLFEKNIKSTFSELVGAKADRIEIIVSFLAILELTRQRIITIQQDNLFSDIIIQKYE